MLKGLARTFGKVTRVVAKNSPLLLTVGGVFGLGATAYLAYKSRDKVSDILDKAEDAEDNGIPVNKPEMVRHIAGAVALPVATGVASVSAIVASYYILNNRLLNIAASLAASTAEHALYKDKFRKKYGDEEYDKFFTPTHEVPEVDEKGKVTNVDNEKTEVNAKGKNLNQLMTGEWFDKSENYVSDDPDYNEMFIKSVNETAQNQLMVHGFLVMNDLFDQLGFERTRAGAAVGWGMLSNFELNTQETLVRDRETGRVTKEIYVKWPEPTYIYDQTEFKH